MAAPLRMRDVRSLIQEMGFERAIVNVLERLIDERAGDRQAMRDLAELMSKCIEQVDNMVQVGDAFGAKLKEIERREQQYRDTDHIPDVNRG